MSHILTIKFKYKMKFEKFGLAKFLFWQKYTFLKFSLPRFIIFKIHRLWKSNNELLAIYLTAVKSWKGWNTLSLSCCQTFPLAKCVFSFNSPWKTDRLLIASTSHWRSEMSFSFKILSVYTKISQNYFLE